MSICLRYDLKPYSELDIHTLWMKPSSIIELLSFLKSSYKASTSLTETADRVLYLIKNTSTVETCSEKSNPDDLSACFRFFN